MPGKARAARPNKIPERATLRPDTDSRRGAKPGEAQMVRCLQEHHTPGQEANAGAAAVGTLRALGAGYTAVFRNKV